MPNLDEKISALEAEIYAYRAEYENPATSEVRKDNLLGAITTSREILKLLLEKEKGETEGNFVCSSICVFF